MLVFLFITLPLAVEHEVVVFVAELIPHEHIWAVFLTTFILGDLFGMALGLMEVTMAERLVSGAQGPGQDLLSADVELHDGPQPRSPSEASEPESQRAEQSQQSEAPIHDVSAHPLRRPSDRTDKDTNRQLHDPSPHHPTTRGGATMEETIHGTTMPVLELSLADGESIVSEAGEFSWMSDAIQMATNTGGGMGGKGIMGAVKRAVSGASFMMTTYTAQGGAGSIAFASKVPGHILPIDVSPGNEFMVHRHGFMAATPGIELSMGFQQSFRGGVFGGEGFILQKIGGTGRAFVDLSGEVIVYDLAAGQSMRVHPGHAGLFQASVTFTVQKVPGLANRYMGSDGHHFAVLTGPGRIWLQSMPIAVLAGVIGEYMPDRDDHRGVEGAAAGVGAAKVLGDMFK